LQKGFADLFVALREFRRHLFEQRAHSIFGERHDAGHDSANALRAARIEAAEKNARLLGL
jgi:hypothetical protein